MFFQVRAGCDSIITTILSLVQEAPIHPPLPDTSGCIGAGDIVLDVSQYNGISYEWNTGELGPAISTSGSGIFIVTILQTNGCLVRDTVFVQRDICDGSCKILAPTAFTPDDDHANDVFYVMTDCEEGFDAFDSFELRVYNRWGELVFETDNAQDGWDGKFKNSPAPLDVYIYYCNYTFNGQSQREDVMGTVTLIR